VGTPLPPNTVSMALNNASTPLNIKTSNTDDLANWQMLELHPQIIATPDPSQYLFEEQQHQ